MLQVGQDRAGQVKNLRKKFFLRTRSQDAAFYTQQTGWALKSVIHHSCG